MPQDMVEDILQDMGVKDMGVEDMAAVMAHMPHLQLMMPDLGHFFVRLTFFVSKL